jgi:zinc/manganese transport system permease protein
MPDLYLTAAPYFGWDVVRDLQELFRYAFMQHAFEAGTIVALSAGVIGYFVVLRGLSFAAHALSHIGFAGATGAVVLGSTPIVGLLVFTMSAGAVMGTLGQRLRGRDVTIGLVMAWSLGLGLLFTYLYQGSAQLAIGILFGQIFGITSQDVAVTFVAGSVTVLLVVAVYRPLLFATLDEEVAEAKGVPVRGLSIAFMVILAVAVSEAVQVVGVLLIFALIVAPAAIAERFTTRPSGGVLLSAILAVLFTWAGLTAAYYIPYPVGFFITSFAFGAYLLARLASYGIGKKAGRLAEAGR